MKKRVLILGGGCAGLACAWQLSCTPERRENFEVRVIQQGWRLGGKGATGRSPRHGARIHEHGLHIWMGFYSNAFALARASYDAWSPPEGSWLRGIEDAFVPHYWVSMHDSTGEPWHLALPPRPGRPWDADLHLSELPGDWLRWLRNEGATMLLEQLGRSELRWKQQRILASLVYTIGKGLARDQVGRGEKGWLALDEWDLCDWLRHHGARSSEVWDAPPIRAFYNLAFAYPDGLSGFGRGRLAAGAAIRAMMRMALTYRGAPLWKMTAGMGDTVFAPLYEVLVERGVRFEFFHRVDELRGSEGKVDTVRCALQAKSGRSSSYAPLEESKGLCVWPDRPKWSQLDDVADGDLEADVGVALGERVYRSGQDFDEVVLAIPVPAHKRIAASLLEQSEPFKAMVESHSAVATAAAQLWTRQQLSQLGWGGPSTVCTNGPGRLSSWADMSEVIAAENWPAGSARRLLYFVDTIPESFYRGLSRQEAAAKLRDEIGPRFTDGGEGLCFDERELCHEGDESGAAIRTQYFRVNMGDSERYVLSPPGSTKYRLGPSESGFANLWLAGDWTRTSINGGSVEAAAESGRRAGEELAARVLGGSGKLSDAPV